MPKLKGPPIDLVAILLARARSEPDAVAGLLDAYFCSVIEKGGVPDQRVLEDLAKRVRAILDGMPADEALGLVRDGKHSRRTHIENKIDERNLECARRVFRRLGGMSATKVFDVVAKEMNVSTATVRDAYYEWRDHIKATE